MQGSVRATEIPLLPINQRHMEDYSLRTLYMSPARQVFHAEVTVIILPKRLNNKVGFWMFISKTSDVSNL